jgi:hypothetical protein
MNKTNTKPLILVFFFIAQLLCRVVVRILFRFRVIGRGKIPKDGACVLVSNHISFVDWLLISSVSPRPIRFVLYVKYYMGPFRWLFDLAQVVPICSKAESEEIYKRAFDKISKHLDNNRMVCIFPEGMLTTDGEMHVFKRGVEKIIRRNRVPVIPSRLSYSLWGHWSTKSLERFRVWIRPGVVFAVSDLIDPDLVTAASLEDIVRNIKV